MNDTYVECLVPHKKSPLAGFFKVAMYALGTIMFVLGLIGYLYAFIPAVIFVLLAHFVSPMFDIEYEYLYLDKSISIDKVLAREKRKHVTDIDLNKMEIMAVYNSHELDSYKANNTPYKEYGSACEDARVYVIVVADSEGRRMVGIEPNEAMLSAIKTVFPRKVIEY